MSTSTPVSFTLRDSKLFRHVRPLGPDDYEAWDDLLVSSYGDPGPPVPDWRDEEHREVVNYAYGLYVDGRLAATTVVRPIRLVHGERLIPGTLITAVATHPEHRRCGHAATMFRELLEVIRESRHHISILYPFSFAFYRKLGWEHVADFVSYEIPLSALPPVEAMPGRTRTVARGRPRERVQVDKVDVERLDDVYRRYARRYSGMIERDDAWWRRRVLRAGKELTHTALWEDAGGRPGAYAVYSMGPMGTYPKDITVRELAAVSSEARRGILGFLKGHEAQFLNLKVNLPLADPLVFCLDNPRVERKLLARHMLRLVDVPAALEAMAEPEPGFEAGVVLSVSDPVCPWNEGDWLVEARQGRVTVRPAASWPVRPVAPTGAASTEFALASLPRVELNVTALAQITGGFLSPESAAEMAKLGASAGGEAAQDPAATAILAKLFGRRPSYVFDAF